MLIATLLSVLLMASFTIAVPNILGSGVDCDNVRVIMDRHNELRRLIARGNVTGQPKAANMQAMVWDDNLALVAQAWANNAQFMHNKDREDPRFLLGENLYIYQTTDLDKRDYCWTCAVDGWFEEHMDYTYQKLVPDPKTGHYTQVVWADSIYVGCGASIYVDKDGWLSMLYVCNYGPTGNWVGEYPYAEGDECEDLCCIDLTYDCRIKFGKTCSLESNNTQAFDEY